jgi:hypothetical protein
MHLVKCPDQKFPQNSVPGSSDIPPCFGYQRIRPLQETHAIGTTLFRILRRHWPAYLVIVLGLARNLSSPEPSWLEVSLICLAGAGVLMNGLAILLNGGMPVATSADQISAEERDFYHPIDEQTRLRWLADWIDVGTAWYSPGDFVIDAAAVGLILRVVYLLFAA